MAFPLLPTFALTAVLMTAPAAQPCPTFGPGEPFPWETGELAPGDQWAWVFLDLDESGRVTKCRMGETNIRNKDRRFYVCSSFKKSWHTDPVVKDGKPVETTVKRYFIIRGDKYEKVQKQARAQFFRDHPNERPECYSEYRR